MSKQVSVRFDERMYEKLEREAKALGKSLSQYVRGLIKDGRRKSLEKERVNFYESRIEEIEKGLSLMRREIGEIVKVLKRIEGVMKYLTYYSVINAAIVSITPVSYTKDEIEKIKRNRDQIKVRVNDVVKELLGEDVLDELNRKGLIGRITRKEGVK